MLESIFFYFSLVFNTYNEVYMLPHGSPDVPAHFPLLGVYLMFKPQSHRIVRFLNRTIGFDLANVRPIGNVCYDLQKRSVAYSIGLFC